MRVRKRHLVSAFVAVTYLWTWGVNLPQLVLFGGRRISQGATTFASFAPSIVALLVLAILGGRGAARELLARLRPGRADALLIAAALTIAMGSTGLAFVIYQTTAHQRPSLPPAANLFGMTLLLIPLTGLFEELGWRGFMLDRLQQRMPAARATLYVASVWGVWHIPMLLRVRSEGDRTPLFIALFLAGTVPLSVVFTALYAAAERRLLPVIVFHAAVDSSIGYFLGPMPRGDLRAFAIWIGIIIIVAAVVVATGRLSVRRLLP
jgi:membrane protease YdiL (CAAX protease family)